MTFCAEMNVTLGHLQDAAWMRSALALMAIGLTLVSAFCLVHCTDDAGMSPEQCAKTMVPASMTSLVLVLLGLRLGPELSLGLPPLALAPLDRPPQPVLR